MTLDETVNAAFASAFPGVEAPSARVVPATDPRFGDYQCNDALKIAKKAGMKPRDAAQKVLDAAGDLPPVQPPEAAAAPPEHREDVDLPHGAASADEVARHLAEGRLETIHSSEPTLESVFLELTGRKLEGE